MTKSTDTRQITQIVRAILQKNLPALVAGASQEDVSVEDAAMKHSLLLEVELIGAWQRYMNEREDGLSPAQVREKIASEYNLGMSKDMLATSKMVDEIQNVMALDVDMARPEWQAVVSHCLKMAEQGQTIRQFREWCDTDKFNSPKKHQIAQNPILIKSTWRSAFEKPKKETDPMYEKVKAPEDWK